MGLIYLRPWTQQPQYAARVSQAQPAQLLFTPFHALDSRLTAVGTPTKVATPHGRAWKFGATNYFQSALGFIRDSADIGNNPTVNLSLSVTFVVRSNAGNDSIFSIAPTFDSGGPRFLFDNQAGTLRGNNIDLGPAVIGKRHTITFTYSDITPNPRKFYLDGRLMSTVDTYTRFDDCRLFIGSGFYGQCANADILQVVYAQYPAADNEGRARAHGLNPSAIYAPLARTLWAPRAPGIAFESAANSGALAATSNFSGGASWSGGNRLLAVDVSLLGAGVTVTAMTYGGANCTFVGARSTTTAVGRVEQWRICSSDAGAPGIGSNTLSVTLSGSVEFSVEWAAYTDVHQTTPTEGFNSAQATNAGTATNASVNVTSVADNCWIHAAVVANDTAITAGNTSRNNISGTVGSGGNEDNGAAQTPAGTVAMFYSGMGLTTTWAIAGYAIRPSSATSGSTSRFNPMSGRGGAAAHPLRMEH